MSYAIIQTGSKQYRVQAGDVIDIELLDTEANNIIEFKEVLLVHDGRIAHVGAPLLAGGIVRATVLGHVRGPKVIAYKYKRRKNYRKKIGHRQDYTRVKITEFAV